MIGYKSLALFFVVIDTSDKDTEVFEFTIMSENVPDVKVKNHYPTGGAKVTVSVWILEEERRDLIERIMAHETLVHDRERTVEALQLADDGSISPNDGINNSKEKAIESFTWEVSLVE